MTSSGTLVVTLHMDDQSAEYFTALRQAHFPPEINYLPAHISLFHSLPALYLNTFRADVERCRPSAGLLRLQVAGVRSLGRGVAYKVDSPELGTLRRCLAQSWEQFLSPQDRQSYQPHITIQNKAAPEKARQLHEELTACFQPRTITGTGVDFWHYRGGPWDHAAFVPFGRI